MWLVVLMGHASRSMEDSGPEGDLNSGCLTQEVSERKNFSMMLRHCSCDILLKSVAALCRYPNSLPEGKVKRFRLIALTKEVSKKSSLDFILWFSLRRNV